MATSRPNQTYAPNGLLYDPITARGQYNNAVVNNGGLLSNGQAAGLHSQTGYMPNKTVGGKYGQPMPGGRAMPEGRPGYGPYGSAMDDLMLSGGGPYFGGAAVRPVGGRPTFVDAQQDTTDYRSQAAGLLGPGGQVTPAYLEAIRAARPVRSPGMAGGGGYDPFAGGTPGGMPYAPTPRNAGGLSPLEARESSRQAALADAKSGNPQTARGMVTARAIQRQQERRGRIASRNAPQQGMGLLEQMAMRDPRNAAQLLAMRQQGLLAQQGLSLQQQQLQQQGMLAGNRMGLDRELGMLNAQNQRDANQATLARFGKQDQQQSMENFANLVGALPTLKQTNPALARQIEMQLPIMAGNSMGLPFSNAPSRQVARQKPPGAVGGILSQDEWDSMGEMTPEQQRAYLRSKVTDPVQRRTVEKQLAGPGVLDYFWEGAGMAGSAISPRVNGLFDDPANPRDPQPGELEISPNDTPQQRAIKMRLRQRLLQRQQYIPR
jgi:hypothetical protein